MLKLSGVTQSELLPSWSKSRSGRTPVMLTLERQEEQKVKVILSHVK